MERRLRHGYTTGSCAAAAAKAAAYMLLTGHVKDSITIQTPKGITYTADIIDTVRTETSVSCAVVKDGGDDSDVTSGTRIYASVSLRAHAASHKEAVITIDGGTGIGRVTRPGLDQPVGNAAINHVPREMITDEVRQVCRLCDYRGELEICISAPDGERIAEHTFNPRLGIVGGISILGTSGIVEPMSSDALRETIRVELRQRRAEGADTAIVTPGNYGQDYMLRTYGYDTDKSVKCSNFIGDTIDYAVELGYTNLLLTGHIGKLVKLSGGMMNTHSREGDCRMELLSAAAIRCGAKADICRRILDCLVTEEALAILNEAGLLVPVMRDVTEHIAFYMEKRAAGAIHTECMMYSNDYGLLGKTEHAEDVLKQAMSDLGEE